MIKLIIIDGVHGKMAYQVNLFQIEVFKNCQIFAFRLTWRVTWHQALL